MPCHVAILKKPYIDLILAGRKTVESRLSRSRCAPFDQVAIGERIFIKASGGSFMATATAQRIDAFDELAPTRIADLQARFDATVCGNPDYWHAKRDSRFATFITLANVEPIAVGPSYPKSAYRAWFVLPDTASPLLEVPLTAGAIGNRYVPTCGRPDFFTDQPFTLELPDGSAIATELYDASRLRWRGWGPYFAAVDVQPGDHVRFVRLDSERYRVTLIRRTPTAATTDA